MPYKSSMNLIVVRAAYDPDAKVWWVEDSAPLNGLNIEAATIDELRDKLPAAVIDLLETKTPGAYCNRGHRPHAYPGENSRGTGPGGTQILDGAASSQRKGLRQGVSRQTHQCRMRVPSPWPW